MFEEKISERSTSGLDRQMQRRVTFAVNAVDVGTVEEKKLAGHQGALRWKIESVIGRGNFHNRNLLLESLGAAEFGSSFLDFPNFYQHRD